MEVLLGASLINGLFCSQPCLITGGYVKHHAAAACFFLQARRLHGQSPVPLHQGWDSNWERLSMEICWDIDFVWMICDKVKNGRKWKWPSIVVQWTPSQWMSGNEHSPGLGSFRKELELQGDVAGWMTVMGVLQCYSGLVFSRKMQVNNEKRWFR